MLIKNYYEIHWLYLINSEAIYQKDFHLKTCFEETNISTLSLNPRKYDSRAYRSGSIDLFWHATNATKETIRFYELSVPFKATVFF